MKKNLHGRILKREPKEQHLSTVHKSCSIKTLMPHIFYLSNNLKNSLNPNKFEPQSFCIQFLNPVSTNPPKL